MLRVFANAVVATVIAPVCARCSTPLDDTLRDAVCSRCWAAIPPPADPLCDICGDALNTWRSGSPPRRCTRCGRRARSITRGRSIAPYEGALRDILRALKYHHRRSVARGLAQHMAQAGVHVLRGADLAVPVPLHWIRRYSRGFNQAEELARHLPLPMSVALRRSRATVTQTDLPEARRHENVDGAFSLRSRSAVEGRVIVLVDDVSTTGATVDACARVLLAAGAREVRALTAARAAARLP